MIKNGMRSILVFIFTCLLVVECSAQFYGDNSQNLVKNPSFEEKTGCPDYTSVGANQEYIGHLDYWTDVQKESTWAPNFFTYDPDCYLISIKHQTRFRSPRTGQAMVLVYCLGLQNYMQIETQSRTFLRGELKQSMVKGRRYFVSYYAKAYDTDAKEPFEMANGGINSFSIHFCDSQYWFGSATPFVDSLLYATDGIKPQLTSSKYLLDTLNYEEVIGIYKAQGGERYITMGNFLNNIATKRKIIANSGPGIPGAAYFIDDITIAELPDLGPDTCLALNASMELKVPDYINLPAYRFLWSTGKKAKSISINKPGTYWVEYEMGYTKVRDSIVVKSQTQRIDLNAFGDHQSVCSDSIDLAVKWPGASNFLWNNGQNTSAITARKVGTYTVRFQRSNGCLYRESVTLEFPKPFVEGIDSTYCYRNNNQYQYVEVKPNGNYEYLYWYGNNGKRSSAGDRTRLGSYPGTVSYHVEANLKGCTYMDTVYTSLKRYGIPIFQKDRVLCSTPDQKKENLLKLGPWITGEKTEVLWNTGSTDSFIYINQTDTYWVQTKNQFGCSYTDTVYYEYFRYGLEDTLLCLGDTLYLHLDSPSIIEMVTWYFNDYRQTQWTNLKEISILDTGKYAALIRLYDPSYYLPFICNIRDTFHFSYDSIQQVLGNDTTACNAQSLVLSTLEDFDQYQWSTGATGSQITVLSPQKQVSITVARNGCKATDTLNIFQDSLVYLRSNDTSICPADSIKLSIESNNIITWQNGSKEKTRTVQKAEVYRFSLENEKCKVFDSIGLSHFKVKPLVLHQQGDSICLDDTYSLQLISGDSISYFLNDQLLTDFKKLSIGEYILKADNGCEFLLDTFQVAQQNCELTYYLPNAFSPNADGINDEWKPIFTQPVDFYRLDIFDRSGVRVFWSDNSKETWDGKFRGKPLPIGLYTFVISVKYTYHNEVEELLLKGGVVLVK